MIYQLEPTLVFLLARLAGLARLPPLDPTCGSVAIVELLSTRWILGCCLNLRAGCPHRTVYHPWHFEKKEDSCGQQGSFPQFFSGCECVHISLSTFRKVRGRLNSTILGPRTYSSHMLSPIHSSNFTYAPFIYAFKTRLSYLRAAILAFREDLVDLWSRTLNSKPNRRTSWGHWDVLCGDVMSWGGNPRIA